MRPALVHHYHNEIQSFFSKLLDVKRAIRDHSLPLVDGEISPR